MDGIFGVKTIGIGIVCNEVSQLGQGNPTRPVPVTITIRFIHPWRPVLSLRRSRSHGRRRITVSIPVSVSVCYWWTRLTIYACSCPCPLALVGILLL